MEKIVSPFGLFSQQFCKDIELSGQQVSGFMLEEIQRELQLYDDDEKLQYIKSKQIEVREKLIKSIYFDLFPIDKIENELTEGLAFYFMWQEISHATAIEYSKTLIDGQHEYNPETKKIIVRDNSAKGLIKLYVDIANLGPYLDFSFLDEYKQLVEHIQLGMLFLKLRKLDTEIKEKLIAYQNKKRLENRNLLNN